MPNADIGLIGLAVMGQNLVLNMNDHGYTVAVFNRTVSKVDDFIEGLLCSMTHPRAVGESFNIGNSRAVVTIFGLAQTVVRVLGSQSNIRFTHKAYADVELRVPSVKKARELIGFEAKVDLEEGIRQTAEFYRSHRQ